MVLGPLGVVVVRWLSVDLIALAPMARAAVSRVPVWAPELRQVAAGWPRACAESPARPPAPWRYRRSSAAAQPRIPSRAGQHFGAPLRDRAQAVAYRMKWRQLAPPHRARCAPCDPTRQAAATS